MNLNNIATAPHAQGFIKVACEGDPAFGDRRTVNEFIITARHHELQEVGEPRLAAHPLQAQLAAKRKAEEPSAEGRQALKEIPIRLFFNKPENALSIKYQAFASIGNVPVCSGDGKNAKRQTRAEDGTPTSQDMPCPGPELCPLVQSGEAKCNRQVKLAVQIVGQNDPLSVFEVRTSSLNTYRALRGQLQLIYKRFGGLRHVPLKLTLWQASNDASSYQPFSLMQLELDASTEIEAAKEAKRARAELIEAGIVDDVDDALCTSDEVHEAWAGGLDFQAVSEFYDGAPATRRPGDQAITPQTVQRMRKANAEELGNAATSAFSNAVRQAAPPATATSGP
jgi:hypothetical protein